MRRALRQLAEGLHALHESGRLHCDLKPANVLVFRRDERLVICDFGLVMESSAPPKARSQRPRAPHNEDGAPLYQLSMSREIAGTLGFMSPEQLAGAELSPKTDWYAVGVMLYQALTLRMPFDSQLELHEVLRPRQESTPEPPERLAKEAPRDLCELALSLLAADPSARPGYAEILSVLHGRKRERSLAPPITQLLIGRERELAELDTLFVNNRQQRACVALVSGASGMGKSAVIEHFLMSCQQADAIVLRGRCYECEDLPYKAFDPLMDALSEQLFRMSDEDVAPLLPQDISALGEMFPVLARVPRIAERGIVSHVADPFERKRRAAAACRELLRRLSAIQPVVIYVDDLQWGDLDSAPFFGELLRGADAPPVMLLFAYRTEDEAKSPLPATLQRDFFSSLPRTRACMVQLGALAEADAERLALHLLTDVDAAHSLSRSIVQEAGGSPFFIRELCSFARTHGTRDARGLKLETVIEARVRALPAPSRKLLELVAAAGRPELQSMLHEASGLGPDAFAAGQILKAQNMVQSMGAHADPRVEAYHDRIRETVYRSLPASERCAVHRSLAVALEALAERHQGERDAEALYEHWRKAGDPGRARECALSAAHKAEQALAFLHAAKLYQAALELTIGDAAQRSELEAKLGNAWMLAGRGRDAADAYFRAMQGASEHKAQDYRRLAITQLLSTGHLERAFRELSDAEDVLGMRFPRTNLKAIAMLVAKRLRTRLTDETLARLDLRAENRQRSQRLENLYRVSTSLSVVDFLRGGVYTAEHTLRALEHGSPYHVGLALGGEIIRTASANKRPERTQWTMDRALALVKTSEDPYAIACTTGTVGVGRYLEGRFKDALPYLRESQRIHRERLNATAAWDPVTMIFFEMRALSQIGKVHEIVQRVPEVVRDAEERGDLYASTVFRLSRLSWAWIGPDEPDVARAQITTAERRWQQQPYQLVHYYTLQALGELALYTDHPEDVLSRALREHKQMRLVSQIQVTRVEQRYLTARLWIALARKTGDRAPIKKALESARSLRKEKVAWADKLGKLMTACALSFDSPAAAAEALCGLDVEFEALDMLLAAAVARYRLGQWLGGDEGRARVDAARAAMLALGCKNPEAFVRMLAPARS